MGSDDIFKNKKNERKKRKYGYKIAWSNQSFEYWLFLHFEYSDAALHRNEWNKKLTEQFAKYNLGDGIYRKNYKEIYEMLERDNRIDIAIKNAKRRMTLFVTEKGIPSKYDPGTSVHLLVDELRNFLKE